VGNINDAIGIYYELPDGRIVYTYGFNDTEQTIGYYFDGYSGHIKNRTASYSDWQTWVARDDLKDFPNAIDPRVPYVFDLHWDIKYLSQIKEALKYGIDHSHEDFYGEVQKHYPELFTKDMIKVGKKKVGLSQCSSCKSFSPVGLFCINCGVKRMGV